MWNLLSTDVDKYSGVMTPVTLLHHIICMCSTMTGLCRDNYDNLLMALKVHNFESISLTNN